MSYAPIRPETNANHRDFTRHSLLPQHSLTRSSRSTKKRRAAGSSSSTSPNGFSSDYPIIVHCHLCWDWVWQRPQQFISRLSKRHKILFVETIGPDAELASPVARFRIAKDFPNVTLLRLQFPLWRWSNARYVDDERRRIVQEFVAGPVAGQFDHPVQWFYDPMTVRCFAGQMGEILTVYDCMDELSKFKEAPPEILEREAELLRQADVVFTGGRKLFESKSRFHKNCHFYGCGVDWQHFGRALAEDTAVPKEVASLKKPVLGYFGVIDERMDYELIGRLAKENPDWSIAMVGPVLKVKEEDFPKYQNLHWLGKKDYEELPALCKGFDVCLMPFALNESTEYINPTKALEYMATGRPIVSTAVADVVHNFGSVIQIGSNPDEFIAHCRKALDQPDPKTIAAGLQMARENSWESIVAKLENHVNEALRTRSRTQICA
jgi:glycosyltransferase involved in cell wall biosynthesis